MEHLIPYKAIEQKIFVIRGQKVMIDRDIAELYGVETKNLNRQVKRNIERFPDEFMFQLTEKEKDELVTNWHQFDSLKHSYQLPYAFTEHGVAMLASVLKSSRAVKMSILIIKAFVKLREILSNQDQLTAQLKILENKVDKHDKNIQAIFKAINQLVEKPNPPRKSIGFKIGNKNK